MYGIIIGIVLLILIGVVMCWIVDRKMRKKEVKLRMTHKKKILKKIRDIEKSRRESQLNRSKSMDMMSESTDRDSTAYMSMNRDSGSFMNSYGRPSRVRMKGGMLTEYLTKIRLSKQLSMNDIGSVNDSEFGSLAQKQSTNNEPNLFESASPPMTLQKFSAKFKVSEDLEIDEVEGH